MSMSQIPSNSLHLFLHPKSFTTPCNITFQIPQSSSLGSQIIHYSSILRPTLTIPSPAFPLAPPALSIRALYHHPNLNNHMVLPINALVQPSERTLNQLILQMIISAAYEYSEISKVYEAETRREEEP